MALHIPVILCFVFQQTQQAQSALQAQQLQLQLQKTTLENQILQQSLQGEYLKQQLRQVQDIEKQQGRIQNQINGQPAQAAPPPVVNRYTPTSPSYAPQTPSTPANVAAPTQLAPPPPGHGAVDTASQPGVSNLRRSWEVKSPGPRSPNRVSFANPSAPASPAPPLTPAPATPATPSSPALGNLVSNGYPLPQQKDPSKRTTPPPF